MSSEKTKDTRTKILDASWKLLEEGKGGGVRMSDIAKAAGVSRQAVYMHFPSRAELLTATTRHLDEVVNTDKLLARSRAAKSGRERLEAYIDAWTSHILNINGVARALLAMRDTDEEAKAAWVERMDAMRHGCAAAVDAIIADDELREGLERDDAVDLLWAHVSFQNWRNLTEDRGWDQDKYVENMKWSAEAMLLRSNAT
ncbi:MAG: TetR/AcrR family transcriptional regulator [Pseudomonadota bacterium]